MGSDSGCMFYACFNIYKKVTKLGLKNFSKDKWCDIFSFIKVCIGLREITFALLYQCASSEWANNLYT